MNSIEHSDFDYVEFKDVLSLNTVNSQWKHGQHGNSIGKIWGHLKAIQGQIKSFQAKKVQAKRSSFDDSTDPDTINVYNKQENKLNYKIEQLSRSAYFGYNR